MAEFGFDAEVEEVSLRAEGFIVSSSYEEAYDGYSGNAFLDFISSSANSTLDPSEGTVSGFSLRLTDDLCCPSSINSARLSASWVDPEFILATFDTPTFGLSGRDSSGRSFSSEGFLTTFVLVPEPISSVSLGLGLLLLGLARLSRH